jgi:hypothetical protein
MKNFFEESLILGEKPNVFRQNLIMFLNTLSKDNPLYKSCQETLRWLAIEEKRKIALRCQELQNYK